MFKKILVASIATLLTFSAVTPANATIYDRQVSEVGQSNDNVGTGIFDALQVEFAQDTDSPDQYLFWVHTDGIIRKNSFNDASGSWAAVFIDLDGDEEADYSLRTSSDPLVGNTGIDIELYDDLNEEYVSGCNAQFWSDLTKSVKWIGFSVDASCLDYPETFGIQGYVDHGADDGAEYDYAPIGFFEVTPATNGDEIIAFEEATSAVEEAEADNDNYDAAVDLVADLPDSDAKDALIARLEVVGAIIDARSALESAEDDFAGYEAAKDAIDALPNGSVKTSFTSRLAVVKKKMEAALLASQKALAGKRYANCAAMNKVLPGGIAKVAKFKNKGALLNYQPFVLASGYALNASLDRDKDGIACER